MAQSQPKAREGLKSFLAARDFLLEHRDYESAYRDFRWPELDRFNWALDYFDSFARGNDEPALWIADESGAELKLSFAEMSQRSSQVANFLRELGVRRGDRLVVQLSNHVAMWEIMLAAIKLGAVVIPSATLLAVADLRDRVERGGARFIVTQAERTDKFPGLSGDSVRIAVGGEAPGWVPYARAYDHSSKFAPDGDTHATDPLMLYFTSGTTALPKLVLHTHQSYPVGHLATMFWIGLRAGDVHLNISTPGWAKHAWSSFFAPWNAGATIFVLNYARFDARRVLQALVDHEVTTLCAPPTVWRFLINVNLAEYPVRIREAVSAGEPLNPEVIERVKRAWGLTIRDGYGQTETTAQIGNPPGQPVKAGSMGRPLPGYDIALLDAEGNEGDEGEIAIRLDPRPTPLMVGYLDDPEQTAQVTEGGFYRTGDVGSRDAEGYITYVGRADDVFKSSDYRISPFELESVMIEHPAVAEAAVVPCPDPLRLSVPKAYLLLRPGHQPGPELALSIFRFVRDRLAPYKRVRRLEFGELPKTISGKIRRVELRQAEAAHAAAGERSPGEYRWEDFAQELKGE